MSLSRDEKTVLGIVAYWYFFLRDKGAAHATSTPHPVGPVTHTATNADGSEIDLDVTSTSNPDQAPASAKVPLRNVTDQP